MNLVLGLLTLLVSTNMCLAAVKGGRRIIQEPAGVSAPHLHLSKGGGGGGALHHTAVVQDPISGGPVLVDKVTKIGGSGGIKGAGLGLGAGSAQYTLGDGLFGQRRVYRAGASQYPFGLLGSDYYSYPNSLLTSPRRVLRRKTVPSNNLSGLRPVGLSSALKGGLLVDPTTSQFSIGDAQIKTNAFGARRNLYRSGLSPVPYGLMGLDYYSYPRQLLTQRRLADDFGLRQSAILGGGSAFTAGDSQIRGPIGSALGQEQVTIVDTDPSTGGQRVTTVQGGSPAGGLGFGGQGQVSLLDDGEEFGQRKVTTTTVTQSADPIAAALGQGQVTRTTVTKSAGGGLGGLRGGQIILSGRQGLGGLRRVKTRPVIQAQTAGGAILLDGSGLGAPIGGFGQRQVITKSAPAPVQIIQAAAPIQRRVISSRRPGEVFLSQVTRPRVAQRFVSRPSQVVAPSIGNVQFTLGNNQLIGGPIISQPSIFSAPRQVVVAQSPQVISQVKTSPSLFGRSIFGNRAPQLIYVDGGRRFPGIDIIGGSRIGDPRYGYTQLPISTSRFATLGGLRLASPSKIGGAVVGGPLGLSAIGQPSKTVTQEEVIGPAGDRQVITTVTENDSNRLVGGKIGGGSLSSPLGLLGKTSPSKIVTQEEVVGPAGDSQIITTVTDAGSNNLVPSKIGGLAVGGLAGVGRAPSQVVTQEEVVGPAGDRQVITTVTENDSNRLVGSKIGGVAGSSPFGFSGLGQGAPTKTITQEQVVGPLGDPQVITTVTKSSPGVGSKIGGLAVGGLAGVGRAPSQVVTQEEVVGPAGDRQVITTVTENDSNRLVGSKIGGAAVSSPFGFSGLGQGAPTKTITQEEVVGPAGDSQIITTVTKSDSLGSSKIGGLASGGPLGLSAIGRGAPATIVQQEVNPITGQITTTQEIAQDPIETAIAQATLGDSLGSSPFGQSILDPLGSGQAQFSVDDVIAQSPFSGGLGGLGGLGDSLVQQNIADAVVQESISSGIGGGYNLGGYLPRVSFLNQYPYDAPDGQILRSLLTRPVIQQQQEVEQILVK